MDKQTVSLEKYYELTVIKDELLEACKRALVLVRITTNDKIVVKQLKQVINRAERRQV